MRASALLYSALTFAALQLAFGPEAVLRPRGYFTEAPESRDARFRAWNPDFGALAAQPPARAALADRALWKFTSFWADAADYVRQVQDPAQAGPPYRYRIVPTAIVRGIRALTGLAVEHAFAVFNALASVATALLFERYLQRSFGFSRALAVLGGCTFLASAFNAGTVAFPMLEPASCLCSCLIFAAVAEGQLAGFLIASTLGIATKEVLVFAGPLWWLASPDKRSPIARLAIACAPAIAFVLLRLWLGGKALEVNYGFDLLHGEFPKYGQRLLSWRSLFGVGLQVFLAFSFLWLGLYNAPKQPFLRRCLPIVVLVTLASICLSSRLTRVLGVLFPIVIPSFLLFFEQAKTQRAESG